MQTLVLVIHLMVAAGLIFLVLIQRSEGGALGMGGGGGNAMMSGRGAANAIVRITTFAGAIFFCTSLGLTWLAGADQRANARALDLSRAPVTAPATTGPVLSPEPALDVAPASTPTPEPASGDASDAPTAPAPADAKTRAGPIPSGQQPTARPTAPPPRTTPASSPPQRTTTTPPRTTASQPPARQPEAAPTTPAPTPAIVIPGLTTDESKQSEPPPPPVQRRPAGPEL